MSVAALVLVGTALLVVGCTSYGGGVASVQRPEERRAVDAYVWGVRGRDLGYLAREYCLGGPRDRQIMRDAISQNSGNAKVAILCPPVE